MRPSYDLDVPLHKIVICLTLQIYSNYVLLFAFKLFSVYFLYEVKRKWGTIIITQ